MLKLFEYIVAVFGCICLLWRSYNIVILQASSSLNFTYNYCAKIDRAAIIYSVGVLGQKHVFTLLFTFM